MRDRLRLFGPGGWSFHKVESRCIGLVCLCLNYLIPNENQKMALAIDEDGFGLAGGFAGTERRLGLCVWLRGF